MESMAKSPLTVLAILLMAMSPGPHTGPGVEVGASNVCRGPNRWVEAHNDPTSWFCQPLLAALDSALFSPQHLSWGEENVTQTHKENYNHHCLF